MKNPRCFQRGFREKKYEENDMKIMQHCPTVMCHASTILKTDKNNFLIAWFGGSREGAKDTAIWMTHGDGEQFAEPVKIASSDEAHWNPVLFRINEKKIILFYKVGNEISLWRTMYRVSEDNGENFGEERELIPGDKGGRGPVRNKPIRIKNGCIIAPGSTEDGIWESFVDISDDEGISWKKSRNIRIENISYEKKKRIVEKNESDIPVSEQSFYGRGVIQPTLWESEDGQIHMLLRSTEGYIYRSDSIDYGETWSSAYSTCLPNNNSGIDLVRAYDKSLYLVYNPVGICWGKRTPISLAASSDNGNTWDKIRDLDCGEGEFAYPAIICDEQYLYITYTYKRENIAFWKIRYREAI